MVHHDGGPPRQQQPQPQQQAQDDDVEHGEVLKLGKQAPSPPNRQYQEAEADDGRHSDVRPYHPRQSDGAAGDNMKVAGRGHDDKGEILEDLEDMELGDEEMGEGEEEEDKPKKKKKKGKKDKKKKKKKADEEEQEED